MICHVLPSDPAYRELDRLAQLLAYALNPDMTNLEVDLGAPERAALVEMLQAEMGDILGWWLFLHSVDC